MEFEKMIKKRRKRKRNSILISASKVLDQLLYRKRTQLANQFKRRLLWSRWKDLMGPTIYEHSYPIRYLNGRLFVAVEDSSRLQEMSFLEPTIRKKINDFIGYEWVKNVRFVLS